jgi:protocatechuate 4,5-dioxygenase alpha chain
MADDIHPAAPGFNLEPPGTYLFDGTSSTRGFALNRFALSLKQPGNRERFLRDEQAYLSAYDLTPECRELIRNRDWTGLLKAGGHLQALLKLAATLGQNLFDIGAHNCGIRVEELRAACPRRVSGIGSLDAKEG